MSTPAMAVQIVEKKYDQSLNLAQKAQSEVARFQDALGKSIYAPPQISVQWAALPAPNLPAIPEAPRFDPVALNVPGGEPGALLAQMDNVQFERFTHPAPALDFGPAPTLHIGSAPQLPQPREVPLPEAPNVTLPDLPEFLTLGTHTFGGVNLREHWLDRLDETPQLSVLAPAPFKYQPPTGYGSELLSGLRAALNARIHSGSGIPAAVEQQLWDRARERETGVALARELEASRSAEALGFALPSGVLAAQLAQARREYHDKLSSINRDIAIKQADLEQQNVRDAIQAAVQLEGALMEQAHKLHVLAFEAAKAAADNAVAAHNAALERFKALLQGYQAYAAVYDTLVRAELSKVEVFKALLSAEQIKADINKSLVERYKAEIDGRMAQVEIYKARVGAAQTLVELERTRIQAGGEQVKAFVATVNAETAKAEVYKARVQGESAKSDAFRSLVTAYGAQTGAQAEQARVAVARYQALIAAKTLEWDGWKAKLSAASARVDAAARQASIVADGYRAGAAAAEAQAGAYMRRWEADIRQYEAGVNVTTQAVKVNADAVMHANDARMEAAKVGLATAAQQLASAWSMVGASAQISSQDTVSSKA